VVGFQSDYGKMRSNDSVIYLDNAATTYPKPDPVWKAMEEFFLYNSGNPGRGGHRMALEAGRIIFGVRERLTELISAKHPEEIVFTSSATESLNLAMLGSLHQGDHLIITSMEHNAVARTAYHLKSTGVDLDVVDADGQGMINPDDMSPEYFSRLFDRFFELDGALDLSVQSILMKKNRPGFQVKCLVHPDHISSFVDLLLEETSTLGVRYRLENRLVQSWHSEEVMTPWGRAMVKVWECTDGSLRIAPEYESCRALAAQAGIPMRRVIDQIIGSYSR
jgi:hypothetical protein